MVYTQMILADRFLTDDHYRETHSKDVKAWCDSKAPGTVPLIVQLGGNDVEKLLETGKALMGWCDGIDLNMGCPQTHALENGYGASLLFRKNRSLAQAIVESLASQLTVPVSVKLRLNDPTELCQLGQTLENAGASWITLHPRFISCRRRRKGPAFLGYVKELKKAVNIPVISNGGVRLFEDLEFNLVETGADGLMVGEPLLSNPFIFEGNDNLDVMKFGSEYMELCDRCEGLVSIFNIKKHFDWILDVPSRRGQVKMRDLHLKIQQSSSIAEISGLFDSDSENTNLSF